MAMRIRLDVQGFVLAVVLLAAFAATGFGHHEVAATRGTVHLSSGGTRPVAALVSGAGLSMRLMRLTPTGVDVAAHLGSGPLRVVALSLHSIELRAADVRYGSRDEHVAQMFARGHVVSLRADHRTAGVRTVF
jgi:hypothetical protein